MRTALVCAVLLAAPLLLLPLDLTSPALGTTRVPFPLLAGLFLAGGLLVFHVEFRDEAHSFTLTELPLVLGLFLASPRELVLARLLGEALALVAVPRQPWLKFALNSSLWLAETCVALAVLGLLAAPDPASPASWAAAGAAVLAADLLSNGVVHVVIRWHGAEPDLGPVLRSAAATAVVNTSLGLVAVLLVQVDVAAVGVLAVVAGVLFTGYRAHSELQQRYASLRLLHDFSEALGGVTGPDEVIAAMLHHARRLLRADLAELVVLPPDARPELRVTLRGDEPPSDTGTAGQLPLLRQVAREGRSVLSPRGATGSPVSDHLEGLGCSDGLVVPVRLDDGTLLVLTVGDRVSEVSTFDEEDRRLFETLASHAAMALEKGRLIDELRAEAVRRHHQALHDPLTGLPNRLRFHERATELIARAEAQGSRLAVLLMDLDAFKDVNDTLGHHTGDELLQEVGRRLTRTVREDDLAARFGGDEFAMVLDLGAGTAADALTTGLRVLDAVEASVQLHGIDLDVRASVGVALWPDDGADAAELLQRADVAMYQAKTSQTRVALYASERDENTLWRLQLAADLRRGVEEGQLRVQYQPKADLRTGEITGAEALVRWEHPEHGRISPEAFIPVAEQTGLITALTYEVLRIALDDCAAWDRAGLVLGVAVNVSVRSLLETEFVDRVLGQLQRSRVAAERVTLELTESSIMGDTHRTLEVLRRLRAAGLRLSVDDFGTGYSSLSYLQRLPVSELKVDRSFVFDVATNPSDRAIVQSVIDLGHSLGLTVVAEGMENRLTWDALVDMGCDLGQGYLLSPPLPAGQLHDWLAGRRRALAAAAPADR